MKLSKINKYSFANNLCILDIEKKFNIKNADISAEYSDYIKKKISNKIFEFQLPDFKLFKYFTKPKISDLQYISLENMRKAGSKLCSVANILKVEKLQIIAQTDKFDLVLAFIEGVILSNYTFLKYKSEAKKNSLKNLEIYCPKLKSKDLKELNNLTEAVFITRDFANEPFSTLDAVEFSKRMEQKSKEVGLNVEILEKKKIEALKMGGLLAVNKGSEKPPTFSVIEYKPEKYFNKKPIVLIGKGIVFDTGGYSIKPTPNSMDLMKFDMAGAAAVFGAIYAAAKNNLPVHIIALIPATDNAVDAKSYVPGDVIKMHDGTNVEVLNTDAEGRLVLADAMSFSKRYNPEIVIDLATLTGAAARALSIHASAVMGNANDNFFNILEKAGEEVYERVVRFPLWEEYGKMIESNIADIKNIGGSEAGAITAGKFLEHFADFPWIHIDIAGPSILKKTDFYRTTGGSGVGTRLIYEFLKEYINVI